MHEPDPAQNEERLSKTRAVELFYTALAPSRSEHLGALHRSTGISFKTFSTLRGRSVRPTLARETFVSRR